MSGMTKKELEEHNKKVEVVKSKGAILEVDSDLENDINDDFLPDNTVMLDTPINGEKRLSFNFDIVTGRFIENCRKKYKKLEVVRKAKGFQIDEVDDKYYAVVASSITSVSYNTILDLPYKDFKKIIEKVRDFLGED